MARSITLTAYAARTSGDYEKAFEDFDDLMGQLTIASHRQKTGAILWNTLRITTEEVSTDDRTIMEPNRVETWLTWTAEVMAVASEVAEQTSPQDEEEND